MPLSPASALHMSLHPILTLSNVSSGEQAEVCMNMLHKAIDSAWVHRNKGNFHSKASNDRAEENQRTLRSSRPIPPALNSASLVFVPSLAKQVAASEEQ